MLDSVVVVMCSTVRARANAKLVSADFSIRIPVK